MLDQEGETSPLARLEPRPEMVRGCFCTPSSLATFEATYVS